MIEDILRRLNCIDGRVVSFSGGDSCYLRSATINLWDEGIYAVKDDGAEMGEEIPQAQAKASEQSRVSVDRFPENYANSVWFLDHIIDIMDKKRAEGQSVVPVFYNGDPSAVGWAPEKAISSGWHLGDCFKDEVQRIHEITQHVVVRRVKAKKFLRCNISNWIKGRILGGGGCATVHEGTDKDGFSFALKEVILDYEGGVGQLQQEIAILSSSKHENIVQYYGTKKDGSHLYVFLELATEGSLISLYQKHREKLGLQDSQKHGLPDFEVSIYTRQILHRLKYLHDRNVIHRDIKCDNILVDADGSVKLADFGLAKFISNDSNSANKGTARWMAPEVLRGRYGLPADIWSLGCTVLEMLTGKFPYPHLNGVQAMCQALQGHPPPVDNSLPEEARNFILRCLKVDPNDRPTAAELLNDPFIMRQTQRS